MDLAALIAQIAGIPGIGPYMVYITLAFTVTVTVCSIVATKLPPPGSTSGAYYAIYTAISIYGSLSLGHAQNLSAPASSGIVGGIHATTTPQMATSSVPLSSLKET